MAGTGQETGNRPPFLAGRRWDQLKGLNERTFFQQGGETRGDGVRGIEERCAGEQGRSNTVKYY